MLKRLKSTLWLLLVVTSLNANPLKVVFVNGTVTYIPENTAQQALMAGAIINQSGKVMIGVNSSVSFKQGDQYFTMQKPGFYVLSEMKTSPVEIIKTDDLLIRLEQTSKKPKGKNSIQVKTRGFQDEGRYQVYLELLTQKDYEMIIERLRRPVNSPEFFYKGRALLHLGQLSAAEKTLEEALNRKPKELALVKEIYSSLAFSYYKLKKYRKVERCFQGMLNKGKSKTMVPPELWVMATMSLDKSNKKAAKKRALQFRKAFPDHPLLNRVEPYIK